MENKTKCSMCHRDFIYNGFIPVCADCFDEWESDIEFDREYDKWLE